MQAALEGLLPRGDLRSPGDTVNLFEQGDSIAVRLTGPDGVSIAEKRMPEEGSCAEHARASAVVVAAWEARFRAPPPPTLPAMGPATVPPGERPRAATAPPSAPTPPAPPPPLPPPPGTTAIAAPKNDLNIAAGPPRIAEPDGRPGPVEVESAASIIASVVSNELAKGGSLEAMVLRRDAPFALGIGAFAVDTHHLTLGSGRGEWRRYGAIIDVRS